MSDEINCPEKTLQNLPYFIHTKTHCSLRFSFRATLFLPPNECPGLCRHRIGYSLGKNKIARNGKSNYRFLYTYR